MRLRDQGQDSATKTRPRRDSRRDSRRDQDAKTRPRHGQDTPRRDQDATKTRPRRDQDATKTRPRRDQDATKTRPRRGQDAAKTRPRRGQDAPRGQERAPRPRFHDAILLQPPKIRPASVFYGESPKKPVPGHFLGTNTPSCRTLIFLLILLISPKIHDHPPLYFAIT